MRIEPFFDPATFTLTYVVWDPSTKDAVVIDPVLDYDPAAGLTSTTSVDKVAEYLRREQLKLRFILRPMPTPTTSLDRRSWSRLPAERSGREVGDDDRRLQGPQSPARCPDDARGLRRDAHRSGCDARGAA
jgi:hypothetical protein